MLRKFAKTSKGMNLHSCNCIRPNSYKLLVDHTGNCDDFALPLDPESSRAADFALMLVVADGRKQEPPGGSDSDYYMDNSARLPNRPPADFAQVVDLIIYLQDNLKTDLAPPPPQPPVAEAVAEWVAVKEEVVVVGMLER